MTKVKTKAKREDIFQRRVTAILHKLQPPPPDHVHWRVLSRKVSDLLSRSQNGPHRHMHSKARCSWAGEPCPIHNPSAHHMREWPWIVRYDKKALTERVCQHGMGHPDPDSLAWLRRRGVPDEELEDLYRHACDGCCKP